jgi:hypothetical protein
MGITSKSSKESKLSSPSELAEDMDSWLAEAVCAFRFRLTRKLGSRRRPGRFGMSCSLSIAMLSGLDRFLKDWELFMGGY